MTVKAGDRILFGKWSGTEVKIDGEDLLIMKESDILGIITTGAAAGQGRLIQPTDSRGAFPWAPSSSNSTPTRATAC